MRSFSLVAAACLFLPVASLAADAAAKADPATAAAATVTDFAESFRKRLAEHVAKVKTATFDQRTWEKNGKKEEITVGKVWWAGTNKIRIDVYEGRGGNATAVLEGETIRGFKRALSFVKLKYHVRDDTTLSIRGHDMRETGPVDDLRYVLENWARVTVREEAGDAVLSYKDAFGTDAELRVRLSDLLPHVHTVRQNGELVEKYEYSNMVWNPVLPDDLLDV